jgi:hypothetical protein
MDVAFNGFAVALENRSARGLDAARQFIVRAEPDWQAHLAGSQAATAPAVSGPV